MIIYNNPSPWSINVDYSNEVLTIEKQWLVTLLSQFVKVSVRVNGGYVYIDIGADGAGQGNLYMASIPLWVLGLPNEHYDYPKVIDKEVPAAEPTFNAAVFLGNDTDAAVSITLTPRYIWVYVYNVERKVVYRHRFALINFWHIHDIGPGSAEQLLVDDSIFEEHD